MIFCHFKIRTKNVFYIIFLQETRVYGRKSLISSDFTEIVLFFDPKIDLSSTFEPENCISIIFLQKTRVYGQKPLIAQILRK